MVATDVLLNALQFVSESADELLQLLQLVLLREATKHVIQLVVIAQRLHKTAGRSGELLLFDLRGSGVFAAFDLTDPLRLLLMLLQNQVDLFLSDWLNEVILDDVLVGTPGYSPKVVHGN
jgi:hypothetical protein